MPPSESQRYSKARNDWVEAPSDAEFDCIGREVWSHTTLTFAFETTLWVAPPPMQWFIRK